MMSQSLKKLFWVSRPISWINTAYPFVLTYLLLGGGLDIYLALGGLFFLIPYNLVMYGINDIYDYESDIKNPRKNSLEGALEGQAFHPVIMQTSLGSLLVSLPILLYLSPTIAAGMMLLAAVFFVLAYSLKGLRFKEIPLLDSLTSSLHFVMPAVVAALAFADIPSATWLYLGAFFAWGMASHAFGAVQDILPDRSAGIKSIAVVLGARLTIWICLLLYIISAGLLIATDGNAWSIGILVAVVFSYALNISPYLAVTDATSPTTNRAWRRFIWLNYLAGAVITVTIIALIL